MQVDRLLTEIERQKKYLDLLPNDFSFPLFNSKRALESQRRNGYRNTAAAAREIVDNALEAGATKIHVVFDRGADEKYARAESVTSIAFIDNGSGMLPAMARYALCLGGGTHFDDPAFIGKFGFGLPNSSINQTKRVEVYTKTADSKRIHMAVLDVDYVSESGVHSIPEPVEAALPAFVRRHLEKEGWTFDHGTVVVWVMPDRLTYRSGGTLRSHLIDDFGVVYRYLFKDLELKVDGTVVKKVDPLFLDSDGLYYVPPENGGAEIRYERSIPVKYFYDNDSGMTRLRRLETGEQIDKDDPNLLAVGAIEVRIARFPIGFVEFAKKVETDAHRRAEIRKSHPGVSFVRAGREIETVSAFPRSARDRSSGLGEWPLLQAYAYHLGIEVKFQPELDEVFGITNDKQTVRPIEEFWRLMASEEIDRHVREEYRWQPKARKDARNAKLKTERSDQPTAAETAAATADRVQGTVPKVPEFRKPAVKAQFDAEAQRRVGVTARSLEEAEAAMQREAKFRPYVIDYFDDENGPFYVPEWAAAGQVVVRINRKHPFFETLYIEAMKMGNGHKVKQAVDVLLITLGKAELTVENEDTQDMYRAQREEVWSPFLKKSMKALAQSLGAEDDEEQDPEAEADDLQALA
jgi:hypothetical protein